MPLPDHAYTHLAPDLRICRVLNGLWQVSGGHGPIDAAKAVAEMPRYHDAGFTTWDMADHYGPAEDFIGAFRRQLAGQRGEPALASIQAFTKWVPYPGPVTKRDAEQAIDRSLRRMGVETIDLLQFHWWEYADHAYMTALDHLAWLQMQGKIRHLALTNFDTERLAQILDHGIRIVSNQVQYSLVDQRPEARMAPLCQERGVHLLTYGTVCGGLLSDRYVGRREPASHELNTASLRKYKDMIDSWGGWPLFQELLQALHLIAQEHRVGIANVAVRAILDRPAVGGVIVGARLGVSQHIDETARVFTFSLDDEDRERIRAVTAKGRDLMRLIGDCGDEYRR